MNNNTQREIKFRAWDGEKILKDIPIKSVSIGNNLEMMGTTLILMQFTGLHDKNNVDFFEGDIATDINDEKYEVIFSDGAFVVIHDGNVIELLSEVASDIEIIGNIYENPNLLPL